MRRQFDIKKVLGLMAMLLLCVFCAFDTVAQTFPGPGLYYIANYHDGSAASGTTQHYNPNTPATNFYMVPASDCGGDNVLDEQWAYQNNHDTPFVTSYKTNKDTNQTWECEPDFNSIWKIIEVVVQENGQNITYYRFQHWLTGKYIVYNPPQYTNRRAFHLESAANPSTFGGTDLFEISFVDNTTVSGVDAFNIRYKNLSNGHRFMNPAKGNRQYYYGIAFNNQYITGLMGVYNDGTDPGSKWYFEPATVTIAQPTITFDNTTNRVSIECTTTGVAIYYTIDGGSPILYDNIPFEQTSPATIRAIAYLHEFQSVEAEYLLQKAVTPTFSLNPANNEVTITSTSGASIYYSIGTEDPIIGENLYTAPFVFPYNQSGQPVKAIARKDGMIDSNMGSEAITLYCLPPTITFANTNNFVSNEVTLACADPDATLYYTTTGADPVPSQVGTIEYNEPFAVSTACTVKAIAVHANYNNSVIAELSIHQVDTPTIQDNGSNAVSITCDTVGVTIYYAIGGDPVIGSPQVYSEPLREGVSGQTVNAIAVKEGLINSAIGYGTVILRCEGVAILRDGAGFVITCDFPSSGVTIYYETASVGNTPNTPTHSSSSTTPGTHIDAALPITVSAIAAASNYNDSDPPTTATILEDLSGSGTLEDPYLIEAQYDVPQFVDKVSEIPGASAYYKVTATTLDFGSVPEITQPFSGNFDGNLCIITGLRNPFFTTVDGGTVRNVILKDVDISSSADTVGAIACVAKGYTRIYNCGIMPDAPEYGADDHPSVSAAKCAGSLVGSLRDDSRVVNCFSYADVSATNSAAGIVGKNQCASDASVTDDKYTKLRTMVVNCMYYGDVTSASTYPVYGGVKIPNGGGFSGQNNVEDGQYAINNYNFYSDRCSFNGSSIPTHYNCSWPAKHEYLTRYEFHRYLLNSNRELCGWWVGAPQAPSTMSTTDVQNVPKDASLMAKWVLKPDEAPFPILKPFGYYPSPVNIDADAAWRESANEWEGKKLGTLSVTVNPGDHAASGVTSTTLSNVVITDMDTLRADYCYRKIQLPYYNRVFGDSNGTTWAEKYAGNYTQYVVTGWEITSTDGNVGDFKQDWQYGYNFSSRDSTAKDLYSVSGRIFAQGGYYYVPNDVTSIVITAHWGNAYYLGNGDGDNYYDRVDLDHLINSSNTLLRGNHPGTPFAPAGKRSATLPNGQQLRVGKLASVAAACIQTPASVYDNAIVLVGNHQYCTGNEDVKLGGSGEYGNPRGFTIMSVDFNFDDEPDYCLEWQLGQGTSRYNICPIRFDFLPVVEVGLALKKDGSQQYYSLGCYRPLGHYEVTETSLIRFGQFEFGNPNRTKQDPLILNAGIFEQYVKGTQFNNNNGPSQYDDINYIIIGGNTYMPAFTPGAHVNNSVNYSTRHCAVNVIGGKFEYLYLTGNFNENVVSDPDNPHCYIDGGWFGHVAAAGKEGIKGNVTFRINHARINEFYGGSTMSKSNMVVTGNIEVTVDNSIVKKYCGGPKFGDMASGKTVTTSAKSTTFGVYYGGGNGGTNYVQYKNTDKTVSNPNSYNWGTTGELNNYTAGKYRDRETGYMANYDMELINTSSGTYHAQAVVRTYFYAAQYSATNTGKITNTLDNCIVKTNFYGAGNLGGVVVSNLNEESVNSTLKDTQVLGSVYGAGFSATIPKVTIYNKYGDNGKTKPTIDLNTGLVTPQSGGASHTYTWIHTVPPGVTQPTTTNPTVTIGGEDYFYTEDPLVDLGMVNGNVTLLLKGETSVGHMENGTLVGGNVFGGGDMSKVNGSTTVKLQGNVNVLGDVFGGGNSGDVHGDSSVTIEMETPSSNPGDPQPGGGTGN